MGLNKSKKKKANPKSESTSESVPVVVSDLQTTGNDVSVLKLSGDEIPTRSSERSSPKQKSDET